MVLPTPLTPLHTLRLAIFATVLLFSLICLALNAYFISLLDFFRTNVVFDFNGLGLALSIITLLLLPAVVVIETLRKGAIIGLVAVELGWLAVLWLLWLVQGALAARGAPSPSLCGRLTSKQSSLCHTWSAIAAFSFLNWLLLMGWFATLLFFTLRGHHWNGNVADTNLLAPASSVPAPGGPHFQQTAPVQNYPPVQQSYTQPNHHMAISPSSSPAIHV